MKKAVLWLVVLVVALFLSWQLIAQTLSRVCLRRLAGVAAEIHSTKLGWKRGQFEVRNLACTNLNAAGAFISANVPLLRIDYEPLSLFRGGLHVYELSCEIQTLAIMHERVEPRRPRAAHPAETTRRAVRVDVLHLKLDGSFSYDSQNVTGKMQATLHDVQDVESFRSLLKSP